MLPLVGPDERPDLELRDDLEPPASRHEVVPVASVGVVEVEDREDRLGLFADEDVVADVDEAVGVRGDEPNARLTKGSTTFSP